jgi:hypothetical protein
VLDHAGRRVLAADHAAAVLERDPRVCAVFVAIAASVHARRPDTEQLDRLDT